MIADLISGLQRLGYELTSNGVNLRYHYVRAGEPSAEAISLLNQVRRHKAEVLDFLRVLEPPRADFKESFLVESAFLKDRLFLAADEAQGQEIERAGGVCYLPAEVRSLLALSSGMPGEVWKDSLGKIHEVKKVFPGARIVRS